MRGDEGTDRAVVDGPDLGLRGGGIAGAGTLGVLADLRELLDFCGRKVDDDFLAVIAGGCAEVVGLLVPEASCPRVIPMIA